MPWDKRTLALPAAPPSVREARRWVCDVLHEVGRPELIPSAELGVSELVTNAILHSSPPVTVRLRGTVEHPRVEVTDQSLTPPEPTAPVEPGDPLSNFGRGLLLVASHSAHWGSDVNFNGTGKTVWFEPSADAADASGENVGVLYDLEEALVENGDGFSDQSELTIVRLLNLPTKLFVRFRHYFLEVTREARLLSLVEPERFPLADRLSEVLIQLEHERRRALGINRLEQAIDRGEASVDLEYAVPTTAPSTMNAVSQLFAEMLVQLSDQTLLTPEPPQVVLDLAEWYYGEFASQGRGEPPTPWTGPVDLTQTDLTQTDLTQPAPG